MRKIGQSWWHIEDQLLPTNGRTVRQVMDIFTDKSFFEVPLKNFNFVKLKIRNRNNYNELSFKEADEKIIVNLGDLEDWPPANSCNRSIKHVKLEIEYTLLKPILIKSYSELFDIKKRVFYRSAFKINELIQPEFYITLPRGLRLKNKGKSSKMLIFIDFKQDPLLKKHVDANLKNIFDFEVAGYELEYHDPYISKENKKESYSFLIDDSNYKVLQEINKKLPKTNIQFVFLYRVSYDRKLLSVILGIGVAISLATIFRILTLYQNGGDGNFTAPLLIAFLSYIALLLKYYDEEYNLPILSIIIFFGLIFGIWILTEIFFSGGSNSMNITIHF